MAVNRRRFLKIAGLCALGAAGKPCLDVLPTAEASEKAGRTSEPGQKRWAMAVNLKTCKGEEGCTKCIDACHLAHNVPKFDNKKDEVKWIWTEHFEHSFPGQHHEFIEEDLKKRPVLVFCNHCDNPPCVRVCPTQATFRREDGIIMMDYHRCIGCRYCVAACPYGSRSFNWRDPRPFVKKINPTYPTRCRGVVEKCNFCDERLVRGLQPACVEACPEGGLVFGDLEDPDSEIRSVLKDNYTIRRRASLGTNPEVYYIV